MANMQNLIEMIKRLFTDEQAKAEFDRDPDGFLAANGAGECSAEDVHEAMALAADDLPAAQAARINAVVNQGGSNFNVQQGGGGGVAAPPAANPADVINHYHHVTNTTNIDDRDTSAYTEVNQVNVGSEVVNDFDTTIASGDGAAAVGEAQGDVAQATGEGSGIAQDVESEGPVTVGDGNTVVDDSNVQGVSFGDGDGSYELSDDDVTVSGVADSAVSVGGDANDGVIMGDGASIEDSQVAGGDIVDADNVPIDVEISEEQNIDADLALGRPEPVRLAEAVDDPMDDLPGA